MAFPAVAATNGAGITTAGTTMSSASLGVVAGDLIIIYVRYCGAVTGTSCSSNGAAFTPLSSTGGFDDASDDVSELWYRQITGAEDGVVDFSWTNSVKAACVGVRISGAADPATQLPESVTSASTTANPDPATTPPGGGSGVKDYLFLQFLGMDTEQTTFTEPAGYAVDVSFTSGTGGAVASNCRIAVTNRQAAVATENAGQWTALAPGSGWLTLSVAVHPPAAPAAFIETRDPWPALDAVRHSNTW